MSKIHRLFLTLVIFVVVVAVPTIADACPYCKYSDNGFGFCRYGAYSGYRNCTDRVADTWSGRTDCEVSGYCTWRGDNDDGDGGSCGYTDIYGNCLI